METGDELQPRDTRPYNLVEDFQKSVKLEILYGFGGRNLRYRYFYGIKATFDRSQPGYHAMKHNQTWQLNLLIM